MKFGKYLLYGCVGLILVFLVGPNLIVIPLSFSPTSVMTFPPESLSLQWYEKFISSPAWVNSTMTSLKVAILVPLVAVPLGSLAAYGLVRGTFVGRNSLRFFILLPIIVPALVTAIAMFKLFASMGITGTLLGFVLAHSTLAIPFVVTIMTATIKGIDPSLESAARVMGANRLEVIWYVTFPIAKPGLIASSLFSFLVSFDELIVSIFISSPLVQTLPKRLWDGIRLELDPVIAVVSTILVVVSIVILGLASLFMKNPEKK